MSLQVLLSDRGEVSDSAQMLAAIDSLATTIRVGTDSAVLLYWWRKQRLSDPEFQTALNDLLDQGLVEMSPDAQFHLRITLEGIRHLRNLVHGHAGHPDRGDDDDAGEAAVTWVQDVGVNQPAPLDDHKATIRAIFKSATPPSRRTLAAPALAVAWELEGKRGGDLRIVLDAMLAEDELKAERGDVTEFTWLPRE